MAKILILDIETKPILAYVWGLFKANVGPQQIVDHSSILSFAAKWLGNDRVAYYSSRKMSEKDLLKKLMTFLDKADIIVAHNGKKFDLGKIKARALVHGILPPSPYKIVDTLIVAKNEFNFDGNSLAILSDVLKCNHRKGSHRKFPGFELWLEIMKNNREAWKELREYNILDVLVLEDVYMKMRPWITNHPNVGLISNSTGTVCPKCGSNHIQWRGYVTLIASKYRRFQCQGCGGWGRSRVNILEAKGRRELAANVSG